MSIKPMGELIQDAARDLPEGWQIVVSIEKDSGTVTLFKGFMDECDYPSDHETIERSFRDALEYALTKEPS